MSLVVMKFGGTSVEDAAAIDRTAAIVAGRVAAGKQPVVVVSAMAKVTDQLLRAAAAAARGRPHRRAGHQLAPALTPSRHRGRAGQEPERVGRADRHRIDEKFDSLDEVLRGLAAILELTPRISDLIVSYGERLSSRMVAAAFCERGHRRRSTSTRARSSSPTRSSSKAVPHDAAIEKRAHEKVLPPVDTRAKCPVMGGFIGSNEAGITTTLGRGGSDFTGALIGGALHAEAIEIWTDVDGIMTTDPRICPDALRVKDDQL